jgi:ABC-type Zn uptake system ZnuABC Zn-binding protein ZnuA
LRDDTDEDVHPNDSFPEPPPYHRKGWDDERRPRLPGVWLGGLVACVTAFALVLAALDGGPTSGADAAEPAAPAAPTTAAVAPASPSTPVTPAAPVLVAGASIPPLADLVKRVGGDRVEVVSIVPQGVDGHTYEPTPSDVVQLSRADIKYFASVDLNPAVTRLAEANLRPDAVRVDLMAQTVPSNEVIADREHSHGSQGGHAHANVHVWTDPTIAVRWVNEIVRSLIAADPAGADAYRANAAPLLAQLQALHDATVAATATVPEANRTLVVYHDSWSYFGRTYGYRVLGALQAADFAEPSAAEMSRMVTQVREADVPAFFGAAVFPTEVLQRVSDEAGVPYVADLADDELPGAPGTPEHSYVGMMVANVGHIVTSLGGDASALAQVTL